MNQIDEDRVCRSCLALLCFSAATWIVIIAGLLNLLG